MYERRREEHVKSEWIDGYEYEIVEVIDSYGSYYDMLDDAGNALNDYELKEIPTFEEMLNILDTGSPDGTY